MPLTCGQSIGSIILYKNLCTGERMSYIKLDNVYKRYKMGEVVINALNGVSFQIDEGEFAVVVGPSGAGKTTVLNILGGMDSLDEGTVIVGNKDISQYTRKMLTEYRRFDIGFVFQFYNLIQNLTARENVELSSQMSRDPMDTEYVLEMVGLKDRMNNFPSQLSGGEQQRVSIARALAKNPKLLLCDEPTGALDYQTGKSILKLLQDTCKSTGMTVVVITHNSALTDMADKVIKMKNGQVSQIIENENPIPVERIEW
jgi:putative ABC transport system ATP-binding protein